MTPPQTPERAPPFRESRRNAPTIPAEFQPCGSLQSRLPHSPPAVDPASVFGCVDWYLYPDTPSQRVNG